MELEATPAERKQLEYAAQHFGFTPDSATDTIASVALDTLHDVLNGMQEHCVRQFGKRIPENEIRQSFSVIQQKYAFATEKVLDNLTTYMKRNIVSVPRHVILPEDRAHLPREKPEEEEDQLNGANMVEELNSFDRLCRSSRGIKYKLAVLEAKLGNLKKVKSKQDIISREADFLEECDERVLSILNEGTGLLEEKLTTLRRLVDQLNERLGPKEIGGMKDDDEEVASKKAKLQQDEEEAAILANRVLRGESDDPTSEGENDKVENGDGAESPGSSESKMCLSPTEVFDV